MTTPPAPCGPSCSTASSTSCAPGSPAPADPGSAAAHPHLHTHQHRRTALMAELLYRLGRAAARRVWAVLAAWAAVAIAVGIAFAGGAGTLSDAIDIPGTPTAEVTERLQTEFPAASGGSGSIVATTSDGEAFTEEQQTEIADLVGQAEEVDGVASVIDPFATEAVRSQQADELTEGRTEAEAGQAELADQQEQLEAARAELEGQQEQLEAARAQAEEDGSIAYVGPELDAQLEEISQGLAEMDAQQQELEQGASEVAAQLQQIELGQRMLDLTDGVQQVSDDGSAAVIPVTFDDPAFEVPQETKDALVALFEDNPIDGVQVDFSTEIVQGDRKSTRLNSSHVAISYAVFCLK